MSGGLTTASWLLPPSRPLAPPSRPYRVPNRLPGCAPLPIDPYTVLRLTLKAQLGRYSYTLALHERPPSEPLAKPARDLPSDSRRAVAVAYRGAGIWHFGANGAGSARGFGLGRLRRASDLAKCSDRGRTACAALGARQAVGYRTGSCETCIHQRRFDPARLSRIRSRPGARSARRLRARPAPATRSSLP